MSDCMTTAVLAVSCIVVLSYVRLQNFWGRTSHPLPPGPLGLPWVGNIIGIDTYAPWKTYAKWANIYGDIVYSRLLGKEIIIINSTKIAKDLLEVRSRNYSDRPDLIAINMCGLGFSSVMMRYGDRWRLHRRFFHQTFRSDAVPRFLPLLHHKACDLLRRLMSSPEDVRDDVFEYTASVILNSTYDYNPVSRKDRLVETVSNVLEMLLLSARPDIVVIVGAFPFLLRLPSWFPGMSFKKNVEMTRMYSKQYLEESFAYSLERVSGNVDTSMVHDAFQSIEEKGISPQGSWMQSLKEASGTVFLAASETSHSALMTFFLMMVLNPAVQEKAQEQIDAVIGRKRLPTMDDRPMLPILDAIFYETLRFYPIAPLSIPHATLDDDVYDGFHIPKGATILTNLWSITHDESKYTNPDAFMPERFLNEDGSLKPNEIMDVVFGFGRRKCVGRHYADASVWGVMAKVLAVFKILKALDENGMEITPEEKYSTGLSVNPLPFKCRIVPRFPEMDAEKLEQLIDASSIY